MRIQDNEIVTATCLSTMDGKDVNGGSASVTDIKFSQIKNDTVNANGILSPPITPASTSTTSENDNTSSATSSGRFKFFKDGKSILELWCQKNGERMYCIPVSKNSTYWPPTGPCTPRQESFSPLSVSDDNSSIQSSPWQRDHCWKQTFPRKNINGELEFRMHRLRCHRTTFSSAVIRRRRRRPYDLIKIDLINNVNKQFKDEFSILKTSYPHNKECVNRVTSTNSSHTSSRKLIIVIQKLLDRLKDNLINYCRTDPGIVSPRKRILREMEKVSLEEMGNSNKKHRARNVAIRTAGNVVNIATTAISGPITIVSSISSAGATKSTNSHSISSILSRDEEPSFLRNSLTSATDLACEARDYSSAESLSNNGIRVPHAHCFIPINSSLSSPYHCPQPIAPFIPPAYLYPKSQGFVTSPPISNHPPYYTALRSSYHDSALWSMSSISNLPRQSVNSFSSALSYSPVNRSLLVPMPHTSLQKYPVSNNGADVPLNLSKH